MALQITPLPPAPQRTDPPAVFVPKADAHVASLVGFVTETNALATEVEANAVVAEDAANSAENAANFKGRWVDLVGALAIPSTVFHSGAFWQLLDNLADVILSEPGVTANWAVSTSSKLVDVKEVVSPYTVLQNDTGFILVFDDASTAVLNIPDALSRGTSVMVLNIGGGDVSLVNTGTDTTRGALILGEVTGYLAVTKITATIWQTSER